MVTILLQKIIELLTGFFGDFIEWANTVGDKIASIKDNTDSLPDIKTNTDTIADDTTSIKYDVNTLATRASQIYNRVNSIDQTTTYIKNYSQSIATSSGTTAAFAEDIANNTLDMDSRLVTIGSDTTQIRADSGNLAADVAEIKDTLGLYLYNTIVTEDAEGNLACFDTDLKDYLTEAKVTIPADAGGITGINLFAGNGNMFDIDNATVIGSRIIDYSTGNLTSWGSSWSALSDYVSIPSNTKMELYSETEFTPGGNAGIAFYDDTYTYISGLQYTTAYSGKHLVFTTPANAKYIRWCGVTDDITNSCLTGMLNTVYYPYQATTYPITFTSITDGAEIDLLNGIIKINTSPVTYDSITPIAIRTYKGVNNIYSDIGTTSVTYRETLKHYLKKQEA